MIWSKIISLFHIKSSSSTKEPTPTADEMSYVQKKFGFGPGSQRWQANPTCFGRKYTFVTTGCLEKWGVLGPHLLLVTHYLAKTRPPQAILLNNLFYAKLFLHIFLKLNLWPPHCCDMVWISTPHTHCFTNWCFLYQLWLCHCVWARQELKKLLSSFYWRKMLMDVPRIQFFADKSIIYAKQLGEFNMFQLKSTHPSKYFLFVQHIRWWMCHEFNFR